jgi:hypothetical protein
MPGAIAESRDSNDFSKGSRAKKAEIVTVAWTADAANALIPSLLLPLQGYLIKAVTNPGTPAPSSNYDIALGDPEDQALDALNGALANRHATLAEQVYPMHAGFPATVSSHTIFLSGTYSLAVSNNAVNSAAGRVALYLVDEV